MTSFTGSPWRSRFLRAPKIGLELAGRDDFVLLGQLATVKLGIKTGADAFFFLSATSRPQGSRVHVRGLNNWEADFALADLLPALRNPRELDTDEGRLAEVPMRRGRFSGSTYYLAPRASRADAKTREYKAWGELQGVHEGDLVRSNSDGSDWYRQTRNMIRSRWVLPYNSGYDYGAVDNKVGAILNGRFVGVEPKEGVDSELLGAVLNSSIVILMRLLEGVATGNEGAFDVGPPSVRAMRVPNLRLMTQTQSVIDVFDAVREYGILPPAPDRNGNVAALRRDLDLAIFVALGMSRGAATVLVDRLYRSYGRWRAAVEDVEQKMQMNRRALARRGGTRAETPVQRTARTVWEEVQPTAELLFAGLTSATAVEVVDPCFTADHQDLGSMFGQFVFPTTSGETVDLRDQRRTDLARNVRTHGVSGPFPLPDDPAVAGEIRDRMLTLSALTKAEIERRVSTYVSADIAPEVVEQVMRRWTAKSIASLREHLNAMEGVELHAPDLFRADGLVPEPPPNVNTGW